MMEYLLNLLIKATINNTILWQKIISTPMEVYKTDLDRYSIIVRDLPLCISIQSGNLSIGDSIKNETIKPLLKKLNKEIKNQLRPNAIIIVLKDNKIFKQP